MRPIDFGSRHVAIELRERVQFHLHFPLLLVENQDEFIKYIYGN